MPEKCAYCQYAENRKALADTLTNGAHKEQPQSPPRYPTLRPMRDEDDRYTITGVATDVLTPTVWVKAGAEWTAYHMDLIPSSWYRNDDSDRLVLRNTERDTEDVDEDMMAELTARAGHGDVEHCPEETALMLGIDEHRSVPIDVLEINQECWVPGLPVFLDSLSFEDAARLLRTKPNLLGECSCGRNED